MGILWGPRGEGQGLGLLVPAPAESEWVNAKPAAMVMTPPVNNRSVRKR